jgi:hypothetical protein
MIIRSPQDNVLELQGTPVYLISESEIPDEKELNAVLRELASELLGKKVGPDDEVDDDQSDFEEKVREWLIGDGESLQYNHFSVLEDGSVILHDEGEDSVDVLCTGPTGAKVLSVLKSGLRRHRDAIDKLLGER